MNNQIYKICLRLKTLPLCWIQKTKYVLNKSPFLQNLGRGKGQIFLLLFYFFNWKVQGYNAKQTKKVKKSHP